MKKCENGDSNEKGIERKIYKWEETEYRRGWCCHEDDWNCEYRWDDHVEVCESDIWWIEWGWEDGREKVDMKMDVAFKNNKNERDGLKRWFWWE